MHKAIATTYSCTPHAHHATTKVLHPVSYYQPMKQCVAAKAVGIWLKKHAYWYDSLYSSWILPPDLTVDGKCAARNADF